MLRGLRLLGVQLKMAGQLPLKLFTFPVLLTRRLLCTLTYAVGNCSVGSSMLWWEVSFSERCC